MKWDDPVPEGASPATLLPLPGLHALLPGVVAGLRDVDLALVQLLPCEGHCLADRAVVLERHESAAG